MAVNLTISELIDGSQIADTLSGAPGTNTGTNLGQVTNGSFSPRTSGNVGRQDWYIRHDGTVDSITDVKLHVQVYGAGTGYAYGGPAARSASADYNSTVSEGNGSGSSKDNADGLSAGLWVEMDHSQMITATNQFDFASRGEGVGNETVYIIGDNGGLTAGTGIDLATAFQIKSEAMVIDSDQAAGGNGTDGWIASAPVDGEIGINGNGVKGDNAHASARIYTRSSFTDGGVFQIEIVVVYTFTA